MSTQLIQPSRSFQAATKSTLPQDTLWLRAGRAIWRSLENVGRARARAEMNRLASARERTDPELADRLRQAARHLG